jgi:hypothetical protein
VNWIVHESHKTRISDSSLYDEVCKLCGATDGRGDERLRHPCPAAPQAPNESGAACMPPLPDRSELFEAARAAAAKVAALPPVERALLHADQRASMARGLLSEECDSLAANAAIDADPLSVLAAEVCRLRGDGAGEGEGRRAMNDYLNSLAAAQCCSEAAFQLLRAARENDAVDVDEVLTQLANAIRLVYEIAIDDNADQLAAADEKYLTEHGVEDLSI